MTQDARPRKRLLFLAGFVMFVVSVNTVAWYPPAVPSRSYHPEQNSTEYRRNYQYMLQFQQQLLERMNVIKRLELEWQKQQFRQMMRWQQRQQEMLLQQQRKALEIHRQFIRQFRHQQQEQLEKYNKKGQEQNKSRQKKFRQFFDDQRA